MEAEVVKSVAAYVALAVPATVAVANLAKLLMEWLKQSHTIREAQTQQGHQITTHYLDKALDPGVPLAIRHQLLRFLATPDRDGTRLRAWAESELRRVGGLVDETNRAVTSAESELQAARNAAETAAAERKLAEAVRKQKSLLEAPISPPVSAAALRAGLITEKKLPGLDMKQQDLSGAGLDYRELRGSDFSGANLTDASLQGSDMRASSLSNARLVRTSFYLADLRGVDFSGAEIRSANFQKARLEGANLRGSIIAHSTLLATYDDSTSWPEGFDPVSAGAVHVAPSEGLLPKV